MRRSEVESRLRTHHLTRVRRGVYASSSACTDVIAAAAHGGTLSCESAARHLGLWVLDDHELHVWIRGDQHQYSHGDHPCACVVHWHDAPSPDRSFEMPSVPRILLQVRRCRGDEHFFVALESARRLRLIDAAGLRSLRRALNARGRRLVEFSRADSDSGLESLLRLRLRQHGWEIRTQRWIVATGRVDLLVGGWLILEADGKENHDERSHRHKDLVRDANAAAWGHATLRFDYAMIVHDWDLVERAIVRTMARRP
jgi:very-short-patch-repair endonuclease